MSITKYIKTQLEEMIFFREQKCIVCNKYMVGNGFVCSWCERKIRHLDDEINIGIGSKSLGCEKIRVQCFICEVYSREVSYLIGNLKYRGDFIVAQYFGEIMYRKLMKENIDVDMVTFVPSTRKRKKKRGYNQSQVLAHYTSEYLNKPMVRLMKKTKETKDQIGLDFIERNSNMIGSFSFIGKKDEIKDKTILLVDDVITTGATMWNCASTLLNNGAGRVISIAIAKSS